MDTPENPIKGLKGNQKKAVIGVAIAAAGYVAYKWMNRAPADTTVPTTTSSTDAATAGTGVVGTNVDGSQNVGNSSNTDTSLITTNDVWFDAAVTKLANGGWDTATVQSALGDFLTGQKLTETEATIVRAAVGAMGGYPPNGPTTITTIPGTTDASKLSAPTGLKVTAHTDKTVDLTWNAVSGAKQYRVYRSGVAQNVAGSSDTTAQVGGLTPGTSYTFYVAAGLDGEKFGPRSGGVSVKTSSTKLKAPTGLKAIKKTATSVTLQWDAGSPGGYLVQQSGKTGYFETVDRTHTIGGLAANHRYSFRVAQTSPGSRTPGPWSGYLSVTTNKK